MKKIAHIQVIPKMSGVQTISYEILSRLPSSEYERYLICGTEDGNDEFLHRFEAMGVQVICITELKRAIGTHDLKAFKKLYGLFLEYQFDIVHTNSTKPGIIARIAAKLAGIKNIIHTVHGIAFHRLEPFYKKSFYYGIEIFSSLFSNHIVLVNRYYMRYYSYLPFVDVRTIYNGVDFDALRPDRVDSERINILFFARLDPQKNPLMLLKAVLHIVDAGLVRPELSFIVTMTGEGELKDECYGFVRQHNLESLVRFTPWAEDKSSAYNGADILCVPSNYEAFGLVFVESGYFGIPSVSTEVEGIPEVVINGKTGLLVQPDSEKELAKALARLINDSTLRNQLGKQAKEYVQGFDISSMVDDYKSLYET